MTDAAATGDSDPTSPPAPDRSIARAITAFTARCRDELDRATTPVVSHAGLWLLLASVAEHVAADDRVSLEEILGLPLPEAAAAARQLLAEPHPTLSAALGAWAAPDVVTPVDVERPIPDQQTLDAWASEHTRGLIESFPLQVTDLTRVVLATALVLEPRWTRPLRTSGPDRLLLERDGLQAIVDTRAAGPVVVATPHSADGIDVVSVRAHPDVPPAAVWQAVDEVVALLDDGALRHGERPADLPDHGHSWQISRARLDLTDDERHELPTSTDGTPTFWSSTLPAWSAQTTLDLGDAPGVETVGLALTPQEPGAGTSCTQVVRAEYDAEGFRAAAVTAMARAMAGPALTSVDLERVDLDFCAPHAVIAVARGGAWEGVPLISAWVVP